MVASLELAIRISMHFHLFIFVLFAYKDNIDKLLKYCCYYDYFKCVTLITLY